MTKKIDVTATPDDDFASLIEIVDSAIKGAYLTGKIGYTVHRRGNEEYITVGGRLLTNWSCSKGAEFHMVECVARPLEKEFRRSPTTLDVVERYRDDLWPKQGGIFTVEDTVDLYRAMMRMRKEV